MTNEERIQIIDGISAAKSALQGVDSLRNAYQRWPVKDLREEVTKNSINPRQSKKALIAQLVTSYEVEQYRELEALETALATSVVETPLPPLLVTQTPIMLIYKCGCTVERMLEDVLARCGTLASAQLAYGALRCSTCEAIYLTEALSPNEKRHLDNAAKLAQQLDRPFTEREILQEARRDGYELKLSFDYKQRFTRFCGRVGNTPPMWILKSIS